MRNLITLTLGASGLALAAPVAAATFTFSSGNYVSGTTAPEPLLAPDIPNLIVTPHSAWGSRESRQRLVGQLVENIQSYLAGAPLRTVH